MERKNFKQDRTDNEQHYNLEYKRWDDYIKSQNLFCDEIQTCQNKVYIDKKQIYNYFAFIEALFDRNNMYITKSNDMKDKINGIRETIFSSDFLDTLKEDYTAKRIYQEIPIPNEDYTEVIDKLRELFREINTQFSLKGIFPTIEKIDEAEWINEKDLAIRDQLKAYDFLR